MTEDQKPQRTPTARTWECCFPQPAGGLVDTTVDRVWKTAFGVGRTPFGDLRNQWRRQHCRTLNPYGSESCPYPLTDCALAFQDAIYLTANARPGVPVGYFRKVARSTAAQRADDKPLARDRGRMDVLTDASPEISGDTPDVGADPAAGQRLHGPSSGPVSIGDLLGALGIEPRARGADDRETSTER